MTSIEVNEITDKKRNGLLVFGEVTEHDGESKRPSQHTWIREESWQGKITGNSLKKK